ncbi:hypothetical protein ACHAXN_012272 [Cyclotella atomus]
MVDGGVSVRFLAWKSHQSKYIRTTLMNRLLMRVPAFENHIDGRYQQSGKVAAALDKTKGGVKRRSTRATHNWVVWQHGYCAHKQGDVSCGCTFDFGFELEDITDQYQEDMQHISMTGVVHSDCKHDKNKLYKRCAGVDRIDALQRGDNPRD